MFRRDSIFNQPTNSRSGEFLMWMSFLTTREKVSQSVLCEVACTYIPLTYPSLPHRMYILKGYTEVSAMEKASVFKSNKSQAVRLPKSVALPEDVKRVDVVAIGRTRIITPEGTSWDEWFDGDSVTDDFMSEREQPADQLREDF